MAQREADPRFDAFTKIFPYTIYPEDEILYSIPKLPITNFPATAKDQAVHDTESPSLPNSDSEVSRYISNSDSARTKMSHILNGDIRNPEQYRTSGTQKDLDWILEGCSENIMIDIGRLLRFAIDNGIIEMCKNLVEHHGANLRSRDTTGRSPIIYAFGAWHGSEAIIEYLTSKLSAETLQSELNHQDAYGWTALHYAIQKEATDLVAFCFKQGSDPSIRTNSGKSIWQILRVSIMTVDSMELLFLLYTHLKAHLDLPLFFMGSDPFREWKIMNLRSSDSTVWTEKIVSLPNGIRKQTQPKLRMQSMQSMQWMHIPCTDGSLIYAASNRVISDYSSYDAFPPLYWIHETFDSPSTVPGDSHLSYRAPSCLTTTVNHDEVDLHVAALVFPCLLLQPIGQFHISRENLRSQRQSADSSWKKAGKYFQIERTLDEAYYPSLTPDILRIRNEQQVVTRECKQTANGTSISGDSKPILMVRQFWIWLAGNWVVTAYTPSGKEAEHAMGQNGYMPCPLDDLKSAGIESELSLTKSSPDQLIARLLSDQVRRFGDVQDVEKFPSPLDIFEIGVVRVLTSVNKYMEENNLATDDSKTEIELMNDIADIRDELAMVDEILLQQDMVLDGFIAHIKLVQTKQGGLRMSKEQTESVEVIEMPSEIADTKAQIKIYRDRVSKIDRDAERVDKTVQDRLNVKRTFAGIRDARASMSDSKTSLLLAIAVIGFTVITILFAPLAFMTALFALNIDELAKHKSGEGNDAVYPSWYIFVTFFAAEVATIALTGIIVWYCVHNKDRFAAWAERIAHKTEDANKGTAEAAKMTTPTKTPTEAQKTQTSAVDQTQDARSSRFSVLSQRRPRATTSADKEERGEAGAPG